MCFPGKALEDVLQQTEGVNLLTMTLAEDTARCGGSDSWEKVSVAGRIPGVWGCRQPLGRGSKKVGGAGPLSVVASWALGVRQPRAGSLA